MTINMQFVEIINRIEELFTSYYNLSTNFYAKDFLLSEFSFSQICSQIDDLSKTKNASLLFNQSKDETFIGLYFNPDLISHLIQNDPFKTLQNNNLNSFCIIVEEISHFHLLLSRAEKYRTTSHLELEWQGDIDKFIFSSLILEKQTGSNQFSVLAKIIFDLSKIDSKDKTLYQTANKIAAKFCFDISQKYGDSLNFLKNENFRNHMIQNFHSPFSEKKMYHQKENTRLIAA